MNVQPLSTLLLEYRYWILIPVSLIEGPGVALVAGALSSLGYFNPLVIYGLFVAKDGLVDGSFYGLGRLSGDHPIVTRLLAKLRVGESDISRVRLLWDQHPWRTMAVAKLSWGLSPALLAVAGIVAVPAALFFRCAVGVALVQYSLLVPLGYYFGHAIGTMSLAIRIVGYVVAGVVLIAIVRLRRRLRA